MFTQCPRCYASFYEEVGNKHRIHLKCPYCRYTYYDQAAPERVEDVDYYWEVYSGLYPTPKDNIGNPKINRIIGLILALSIPFFLWPFYDFFNIFQDGALLYSENASILGLLLASAVFLSFVIAGSVSAWRKYSFPITLSGGIFGVLNSFLLGAVISDSAYITGETNYCFIYFITIITSFVAIFLTAKNKKGFTRGY